MPIPRNIDLTEHSDFGNREISLQLTSGIEIGDALTLPSMTNDDYEKLRKYESFFGRKWHYTDVIDVFRIDDYEWRAIRRCHCDRCGKEIRIPWWRKYGLCYDCATDLERNRHSDWESIFPWNPTIPRPRGDMMDLFNLR